MAVIPASRRHHLMRAPTSARCAFLYRPIAARHGKSIRNPVRLLDVAVIRLVLQHVVSGFSARPRMARGLGRSVCREAAAFVCFARPAGRDSSPGGPNDLCTGGSVTLRRAARPATSGTTADPPAVQTNQTNRPHLRQTQTSSSPLFARAAHSASTTVTVNPIPATPTDYPRRPKGRSARRSVPLTSSSAGGHFFAFHGNSGS